MDVPKFIEVIKKYPILYNKNHKEFKNLPKKKETWRAVAKEMGDKSETMRIKWKGLRDGYTKYKKRHDSTGRNTYENWCWAPHLQFLDSFYQPRLSREVKRARNDSSDSNYSIKSSASPEDSKPLHEDFILAPVAENADRAPICEEDMDKVLSFIHGNQAGAAARRDAVYHLFMSYAETFRKLSMRTQALLKVQLAQLFADAELQEYKE